MMWFVSQGQLFTMLSMCTLFGVLLSACYDLFRLRRRLITPRARIAATLLTAVEDVIFFAASGAFLTAVFYAFNSGQVRIMGIVGFWCGALVWRLSLGRLFLYLLERVARIFIKIIRFLIVRPIANCMRSASKKWHLMLAKGKFRKRKRYTAAQTAFALKEASTAFGAIKMKKSVNDK